MWESSERTSSALVLPNVVGVVSVSQVTSGLLSSRHPSKEPNLKWKAEKGDLLNVAILERRRRGSRGNPSICLQCPDVRSKFKQRVKDVPI